MSSHEAYFQALIENSSDYIVILDANGRYTYASPSHQRGLGYDPEELIGQSPFDFIHPDDAAFVAETIRKVVADPNYRIDPNYDSTGIEYRFRHADGSWHRLESFGMNGLQTPGIAGIFVSSRDVTRRWVAEQAQMESLSLLRATLDSTADGVLVVSLDGKAVDFNCKFTQLWSIPPDIMASRRAEAVVDHVATQLVDPDAYARKVRELHMDPVSETFEELRLKDGRIFERYSIPHRLGGETVGRVYSVRDVTERKRAEEALRRSRDDLAAENAERRHAQEELERYAGKLERSNRDLEAFAYVASHDLQEPLRKIRAFGDRLHDRYGAVLDRQGLDYLERIRDAAQRMQNLIEGLLDYSRVATKAQPFVPVNLGRVAGEVLSDLEARVAQVNGAVEVGVLPTIDADPLQMRQLLQNLIGNGLKFYRAGVPPVVKVTAERLEGHSESADPGGSPVESCRVYVEDNGIGFDEKYADRVFEVFQRLHGRGEYEGAGIGLSVCRKIAERHGGSIRAHSTPGQGSVFVITLPVSHRGEP